MRSDVGVFIWVADLEEERRRFEVFFVEDVERDCYLEFSFREVWFLLAGVRGCWWVMEVRWVVCTCDFFGEDRLEHLALFYLFFATHDGNWLWMLIYPRISWSLL